MIIVTWKEKRLLTLIRSAHPRVRRRMLKLAMTLVSDRIAALPAPDNDNDNGRQKPRDFLTD
ncbi:MAG: hypothetical protein DI551_00640 [Micavibrio aeruginosavorus]|uniref:Uncharacterized protein n=1 Tax=Micavibrio aeruginosavorus TaxID=349221 RepID=A0A2W5N5U7_9BACT|nr:MAG: hypothetical protein DI551_00640 [Micavibrio aeruginosavorus]